MVRENLSQILKVGVWLISGMTYIIDWPICEAKANTEMKSHKLWKYVNQERERVVPMDEELITHNQIKSYWRKMTGLKQNDQTPNKTGICSYYGTDIQHLSIQIVLHPELTPVVLFTVHHDR